MGLLLAAVAGYGVFLVYTAVVFGWTGAGLGPAVAARRFTPLRRERSGRDWLRQAGLDGVSPRQLGAVMAVLFATGAAVAFALFGGVLPAVAAGLFAATFPVTSYRARRERNRSDAREAWPRLLEDIRLQAGSLGRSIPQALFEVGRRAPAEMQPAFLAAEREWLISTDFGRCADVLKEHLADPTADAVVETLLVAHEVGGSDVGRRLAALIEDRVQDLQGRKDARAKQAGVRFARRFVLVVPIGMALAGISIGTGRAAYATAEGQVAVVAGIGAVAACWMWAARLLALPEEQRVFS